MADRTFRVEYAKTARSSCKSTDCKANIPKDTVRIAKMYPSNRFDDDGVATDYFHSECFFRAQGRARKTSKRAEDIEDLEGFEELEKKDQAEIKDLLYKQKNGLLKKKGPKKFAATNSKKKGDSTSGDKKSSSSSSSKATVKKTYNFDDDELFDDSDDNNHHTSSKKKSTPPKDKDDHKPTKPSLTPQNLDIKSVLSKSWLQGLGGEKCADTLGLNEFLGKNRNSKYLPDNRYVFSSLNAVGSPINCKVVFLGQNPIAKRSSASGYAFCDQQSNSWKLDGRKTVINLVRAALMYKGVITKDDDIDTVRGVLREVDLPTDSAREWFKVVARQGVLWLNTQLTVTEDDEDDKKPHEQFWRPVIEEIIRTIFSTKIDAEDVKGVVFVIGGKHSHNWKSIIETIQSESMGVIPIEILETPNPILETFLSSNVLKQINDSLKSMDNSLIDWLPPSHDDDDEEDEDDHVDENQEEEQSTIKLESKSTKSNSQQQTSSPSTTSTTTTTTTSNNSHSSNDGGDKLIVANLIKEDGTKIPLYDGVETELGRTVLGIMDLAISRRQALITAKIVGARTIIEIVKLGINHLYIKENGSDDYSTVPFDTPAQLADGDVISFSNRKYALIVETIKNINSNNNTTSNNNNNSKSNKTDSSSSDNKKNNDNEKKNNEKKNNNISLGTIGKKKYNFDDDEEFARKLQDEENELAAKEEKKEDKKRKSTTKAPAKKQVKKKKKDEDEYDYDDDFIDEDDYLEDEGSDEDYVPPKDQDDDDDDFDSDFEPPKTRSSSKPKYSDDTLSLYDTCKGTRKKRLIELDHAYFDPDFKPLLALLNCYREITVHRSRYSYFLKVLSRYSEQEDMGPRLRSIVIRNDIDILSVAQLEQLEPLVFPQDIEELSIKGNVLINTKQQDYPSTITTFRFSLDSQCNELVIPASTIYLRLNTSFFSYKDCVIPPLVKELTLLQCNDKMPTPKFYPLSLTTLNLRYKLPRVSFSSAELNQASNITKLTFCQNSICYSDQFVPGDFPPNLEYLEMPYDFNRPLGQGLFPPTLTYLSFGYFFNKSITVDVLPNALQVLKFGSRFDSKIEVLPFDLKQLSFGTWFNQPISKNLLPFGLQHLTFGHLFNHSLDSTILPLSLVYLDVGDTYDHPITSTTFAKDSQLETLILGTAFASTIEDSSLPPSLKYLTIGSSFDKDLTYTNIPSTLVQLKLIGSKPSTLNIHNTIQLAHKKNNK
ncbi:SMAD/FHA domain-containing protein [Cavenderia fasciculata]|uniref:SMAD/FHA domain-containing protein n=1 Tax=Cavenderia fasciculata TaxID=261658 RepID=F4Q1D0_CACFS|nr:SMAD/FHA domain-containing protein [Cavenderia fasciculata]EGG18631.1 SMAD/FHA domain-containing protein [Cavenderia fasciculata]|eukprot:XP_004366535.1 SMAD/FHA domain-containing protein [Cavenderia fasciculata]